MWLPSYKNIVRHRPHTCHQSLDPPFSKPQLAHHCLQEDTFYPIVGLAHVQLEGHESFFAFQTIIHRMKCFKSHYIICNKSPGQESTLLQGYYMWQDEFQAIHKDIGNELIKHVAQANGLIVGYSRGGCTFGDNDYISSIKGYIKLTSIKKM